MNPFENVLIPGKYSYGATMGPNTNVDVIVVASGEEQRNAQWEDDLWEFDINYSTKRVSEAQDVENFYLQSRGPLVGFMFDNLKDNKVIIGQGVANDTGALKGRPRFKLFKMYYQNTTMSKYAKRIYKPKNPIKIYNNNVLQSWSVDYNTGTVSLPLIASKEITAILSGPTYTQITCPSHGFSNGDKIYFIGIQGMTQLNNLVGSIVVVNANVFNINIITTDWPAFTYTAGVSKAEKYITGTENITWEGGFYWPIRFKENTLKTTFNDFDNCNIMVGLKEIRMPETNPETLDI